MIKVFGHISPDTDTVGSAIVWAWFVKTHTARHAEPFVLGTLNKETQFVLNHWGVKEPTLLEKINEGDEVMVVDTNNPQELPESIAHATILQIVDHHRLTGGLSTIAPLDMTIKPYASTITVMYDLMGEHVTNLPKDIAGIMLSCILSDTLAFRSPTTTPHDKQVAETLAQQLGVSIHEYADKMFTAKSDVSDFTDSGLVHLDSKKTALGDKNIRVSVIETTKPDMILSRKAGIVSAMKDIIKEESDLTAVFFFVVDILKEEAIVFAYDDFLKGVIETSFGVKVEDDTAVLPGIVSRKKQILPMLKLPL